MTLKLWTLPPFAMVLGALVVLLSQYAELPARYPVHWGISGKADRWVEKGMGVVVAPALIGLGVLTLLAFNAWQVEKSARGGAKSAWWMVGLEWAVGVLFCVVVLLPVLPPMGQGLTVAMLLLPVAVVIVAAIQVGRQTWEAPAAGPECWKWGLFYHNPADPDIMVPKRTGLGYTMNFARGASWWILLGLVGMVAVGVMLLR